MKMIAKGKIKAKAAREAREQVESYKVIKL